MKHILGFIISILWLVAFIGAVVVIFNFFKWVVIDDVTVREFFQDFVSYGFDGVPEAIEWLKSTFQEMFQGKETTTSGE